MYIQNRNRLTDIENIPGGGKRKVEGMVIVYK